MYVGRCYVDSESAWGGWTLSTLGDGVELQIKPPQAHEDGKVSR